MGYRCLAESPEFTRFASYFWKFCSPICSPIWSPVGATFGAALALCEIYVSVGIPSFPSPNPFRERAPLLGHLWHSARFTTSARPLLRADRASVNGARPLWHSARFPDPTFSKSPDCLATIIGPKVSQESIWQGPVASFRVLSRFSENCRGSISPRRFLCQRGAPHEEPLLYSARFASPGTLIFANLWPLWHAGQNIKNHVEGP